MLLTLRGTPFVYMGEELGLEDAVIPPDRVVDPGGRDGCRAPIPWTADRGHGWPADPWLPWPPDPAQRSVATQRADPTSFLALAREVLAARRGSEALHSGTLRLLDDAPKGVLAYEREAGADRRRVWVNFGPSAVELPSGWAAEVQTQDAAELPADAAAILRPR
jgi:alpha-glucosidase